MKKYRDEIAMVCHDMMKAAQSVGAVNDAEMREFEKNCFVETQIKQVRPKVKSPALAAL
jgi:DNA-binding transcriptional regulator YiaG